MQWSHYSEALFDAYLHNDDNIIVQACPGSGKTTNIKHIWSLDERKKLYLVFNKHNQIEAQEKLPVIEGCEVLTLNALGHRVVMNTFGRVKLDERKVRGIIRDTVMPNRYKSDLIFKQQVVLEKAVAVFKCLDVGIGVTQQSYDAVISSHDLEEYDGMLHDVNKVLDINDTMTHVIDFADQLRFPVIYSCPFPQYDVVLGDEVQDFNPIQAAMLELLHAERYILVGDTHQSIYGFRGAMTDSMAHLKDIFHCTEMPLSINYRCAQKIVKEAAVIFPGSIEAWDESPQGVVRFSEVDKEQYSADDIVLCRMNAPLIKLAYQLLRFGTPCSVRGRDIAQGLVALIKRQKAADVRQLIASLNEAMHVEIFKAYAKEDEAKIQRIEDRYNSALLFCSQCALSDHPDIVVERIEQLFSETKGVCLTTVHKAKGLEAQRCFTLETALFDVCKKRARQAWQREQECNVHYVAVTRAKSELVYM